MENKALLRGLLHISRREYFLIMLSANSTGRTSISYIDYL